AGPPLRMSKDEATRLATELKKSSDTAIRIENAEGAPVTITDARIKAAMHKQPGDNVRRLKENGYEVCCSRQVHSCAAVLEVPPAFDGSGRFGPCLFTAI
ncbi:MAG TPA: hypothetical protein VJQ56_12660, partial [Blastocatellia bacterium]|nr:hypothetical protein [Blastocatellia bacterium]